MIYMIPSTYNYNTFSKQEVEEKKLRSTQCRNQHLRNRIQRVKFDNPWTIVWWNDGSITRVKCSNLDTFSEEGGLMAAICKHYYEDTNIFGEMLHKWCKITPSPFTQNDIDRAYDNGHEDGYQVGYEDGVDAANEDKFSSGYDCGYEEGKEFGYQQALDNARLAAALRGEDADF